VPGLIAAARSARRSPWPRWCCCATAASARG